MEYLDLLIPVALNVASFFVKALIIVLGLLLVLSFVIKEKAGERIQVKDLNKRFRQYKSAVLSSLLDKKTLKKELKALDKMDTTEFPRTFVLNFKGDIKASEVDSLRESITAVLSVATSKDEVFLALESPGGMVHGYGLAASQLQRIKDAGIPFVVAVDKVAASGGYMMACLADRIIAAPFAVIGSVGVVAGIPNFNRVLKKNDVDYYQITSGKFKRTVTLLGDVTPEGLEKFKDEIEETHELFKNHIKKFRPQVDIEKIATGEHWYGQVALDLNLIDELGTSDDYLFKASQQRQIKEITYIGKRTFKEKMADGFAHVFNNTFDAVIEKLNSRQH